MLLVGDRHPHDRSLTLRRTTETDEQPCAGDELSAKGREDGTERGLQADGIARHGGPLCRVRQGDGDLAIGQRRHRRDRFLNQAADVDPALVERRSAGLETRQVAHFSEQPGQASARFFRFCEEAALLLGQLAGSPRQQHPEIARDNGDGRSELVHRKPEQTMPPGINGR
jgi:hypothetical protein